MKIVREDRTWVLDSGRKSNAIVMIVIVSAMLTICFTPLIGESGMAKENKVYSAPNTSSNLTPGSLPIGGFSAVEGVYSGHVPMGAAGSGWIPDVAIIPTSNAERNPSMTRDGEGNLYVAAEKWDPTNSHYMIQVYQSLNGGITWTYYMYAYSASYDLLYPSIAATATPGDVIVAFEAANGAGGIGIFKYISSSWSSMWITNSGGDHSPSITFDNDATSSAFAYLTYDSDYGILGGWDITFTRSISTPFGSWSTPFSIVGGGILDTSINQNPSISYGSGGYLYVSYGRGGSGSRDIYVMRNTFFGDSSYWSTDPGTPIATTSDDEYNSHVAASRSSNYAVITYTRLYLGDNDIYYAYTTSSGSSWTTNGIIAGTSADEEGSDVAADWSGGYFRVTYREAGNVLSYTEAPYNSPWSWSTKVNVIDSSGSISSSYIQTAVSSYEVSGSNYPAVAWTDLRNPSYDIYYTTRIDSISIDPSTASVVVGGTQGFSGTAYIGGGFAVSGVSFSWSVTGGIGTVSPTTGTSTTFTATTAGTGTVVATSGSVIGSAQVTVYVLPQVTTVTATPTEGYIGDTISFSCTASGGKGSLTYSWTFGDGGTGSGQSTTHVYSSASNPTFTVRCTVTDQGSNTAYKETQVTIYALPKVTLVWASPAEGYVNDTISFSCTASGGKGSLSYAWTFGDGGTGSGQSTTHVYSAGSSPTYYTVRCTVTDQGGRTSYQELQVGIYGLPEVTSITATPAEGYVNDTISFYCLSLGGGKWPLTYSWTFGDGQTGSNQSTTHVYSSASNPTFTVRCTVTDYGGRTAYKEIQITIYDIPKVDAGPDKTGKTGSSISFDCTVTGGKSPFKYNWNFGDGQNSGDLTVCSTSHVYSAKGTYTAVVTATDAGGKSATDSVIVTISDVLPSPTVKATDPTNNTINVPITTNIKITFNQAMDHASTEGAISASPSISGTFSWDATDTIVTWNPNTDLTKNTEYTVTVSTAAMSKSGLNMAGPYIFKFTTGTDSGPTPPTITSTSPTNSATNVPLNTKISITFDKAMDKTATEAAISASPSISGTFSWDGASKVVTWTPGTYLQASTTYTITVSTAAKSQAGKNLTSQYTFSFTTGTSADTIRPTVTSTSPTDNQNDVDKTTTITINFSKAMDETATNAAVFISSGSISNPVWSNGDKTVTFTTSLSDGTKYVVTVSTGAKDTLGNGMQLAYTFSFTTSSVPPPNQNGGIDPMMISLLMLMVIIVMAVVILFMMKKKKKSPQDEKPSQDEKPPQDKEPPKDEKPPQDEKPS